MRGFVRLVGFSRDSARSRISLLKNMSSMQTYASIARGNNTGSENKQNHDGPLSKTEDSRGRRGNGPPSSKRSHSQSESQTQSPSKQQHQSPKSSSQRSKSQTTSPHQNRNTSSTTKPSGPYTASEYARSPDHTPKTNNKNNTSSDTEEPLYILTLQTTAPLHNHMTALRKKYFPPTLNKLDAHITLFHALPSSKLTSTIIPDIERLCARQSTFPITAEDPYSPALKNILVPASTPKFAIEGVRKQLRVKWGDDGEGWLSEQDSKAGYKPHWTLLNKVSDKGEVERCLKEVKMEWKGMEGKGTGLVLWRYDKGWWKEGRSFEFRGR